MVLIIIWVSSSRQLHVTQENTWSDDIHMDILITYDYHFVNKKKQKKEELLKVPNQPVNNHTNSY